MSCMVKVSWFIAKSVFIVVLVFCLGGCDGDGDSDAGTDDVADLIDGNDTSDLVEDWDGGDEDVPRPDTIDAVDDDAAPPPDVAPDADDWTDPPADPEIEEMPPEPECYYDTDCGGDRRRCFHGLCRDECIFGYCLGGLVCHEGVCVDCTADTHCRGRGNEVCYTWNYTCVARGITDPVIGAMYHQWWTTDRWQGDRGNYVYEPVLGHYDNSNADVVAQHNEWAVRAGINTWVLDTWITDRDDWWVVPNTAAVMDASDATGLNYFFLVDGWFEYTGSEGGFDATAIASRINAKLAPHFERPGYLKVGGIPVLFMWAAWGKPCEAFTAIRAGIEGTVGPIYMTGNNGDTSCWDRVMMYNPYTGEETTHAGQIARQVNLFGGFEEDGHPWAPTTMPGYDDTHVREGNPPIPLDADFFAQSIQTALRFNQFENPWLFVCSWSEWHEGSNMEPSSDFVDPYIFLDTMNTELTIAGWLP